MGPPDGTTLPASCATCLQVKKQQSETDTENRPMDMGGGEEGEGETYGESNMESHITICKIDSQQEFAHDSGNSSRGSVTT